ncbi:MAG TPA: DUF488 family protein [Terriglobales bacterium]|nr:DUF488 family protein [Terriglobales bacterium]
MDIAVKSILLPPSLGDGLRVFVERRWPRSITDKSSKVDLWLPEVAFSRELSAWMATHPENVLALRKCYFLTLRTPEAESALERLYAAALRRKKVTLLHVGKNGDNSAACILKSLMEGRRKPPSPTGPAKAAALGMRAAKSKARRR